eukprot:365388-Chlamydomonas_euryale.AAC.6
MAFDWYERTGCNPHDMGLTRTSWCAMHGGGQSARILGWAHARQDVERGACAAGRMCSRAHAQPGACAAGRMCSRMLSGAHVQPGACAAGCLAPCSCLTPRWVCPFPECVCPLNNNNHHPPSTNRQPPNKKQQPTDNKQQQQTTTTELGLHTSAKSSNTQHRPCRSCTAAAWFCFVFASPGVTFKTGPCACTPQQQRHTRCTVTLSTCCAQAAACMSERQRSRPPPAGQLSGMRPGTYN